MCCRNCKGCKSGYRKEKVEKVIVSGIRLYRKVFILIWCKKMQVMYSMTCMIVLLLLFIFLKGAGC